MESRVELNRAHFDAEATSYDAKHEKATQEIARRIESKLDLIGVNWVEDDDTEEDDGGKAAEKSQREVRFLDYACGTGSMSKIFAPYTTQCIGIDLSEKMVETYNVRARNQGLSNDEMVAYQGDLCVSTNEHPEIFQDSKFFNFDMACVGLGFHHFDDPELAAKRLVSRLNPGGVLMIIDFLPHGPLSDHDHHHHGHGHDHSHGEVEDKLLTKASKTVMHHGFSEDRIKEIFVNAGAGKGFAVAKLGVVNMGLRDMKRDLFMARGTKA